MATANPTVVQGSVDVGRLLNEAAAVCGLTAKALGDSGAEAALAVLAAQRLVYQAIDALELRT